MTKRWQSNNRFTSFIKFLFTPENSLCQYKDLWELTATFNNHRHIVCYLTWHEAEGFYCTASVLLSEYRNNPHWGGPGLFSADCGYNMCHVWKYSSVCPTLWFRERYLNTSVQITMNFNLNVHSHQRLTAKVAPHFSCRAAISSDSVMNSPPACSLFNCFCSLMTGSASGQLGS